jgi:hypothetical protein
MLANLIEEMSGGIFQSLIDAHRRAPAQKLFSLSNVYPQRSAQSIRQPRFTENSCGRSKNEFRDRDQTSWPTDRRPSTT